jgi:hypothetical protein
MKRSQDVPEYMHSEWMTFGQRERLEFLEVEKNSGVPGSIKDYAAA